MSQIQSQKNKKSFSGSESLPQLTHENDKLKTLQNRLNWLNKISNDPKADKQLIDNRIKEITYIINEQKIAS